jgi:hypothetical protein
MFKSTLVTFVSIAAMVAAAGAMAGGPGQGKPAQPVPLSELKERCANPKGFDQQVPPENMSITCKDISYDWVYDQPGSVKLNTDPRTVITSISSDKWYVTDMKKQYETQNKPGQCVRYKEVRKTLTIEAPLSCEALLGKEDIENYCAEQLDQMKGKNPKATVIEETGNKTGSCSGDAGKP